ncbi:hypothetical protein BDV18DRAFT_160471 [Aspergillus unguis]
MFHLVIPSWSKLRILEPLHFPEDLYPLQIEGMTDDGKGLVELNLPSAPPGLLYDVENVFDPNNWDKIAGGASIGIGVGAVTGLGVLATIPIWWGAGAWAMEKAESAIGNTIYEALREEAPRVLGSNERLEQDAKFRSWE